MNKIFFRTLLIVSFVGVSFSAFAVDYTAKHSKSLKHNKTAPHSRYANENGCTKKDMRAIKKFARRAKNEIEKWDEINEESEKFARGEPTGLTKRQLIRKSEKLNEKEHFFISERYMSMKVVYKRCSLKMPMITVPVLYWVPDALQDEMTSG